MKAPQYSQALAWAIRQGKVTLHEKSKTAVMKTGIIAAYEQNNWNNSSAPLLVTVRKTHGLKTELRSLGYAVQVEHS